jgi:LysM repeat protein
MRVVLVLFWLLASPCCVALASGGPGWAGRYPVVAGDTLTLIAQRSGVSVAQLAAANHLDWRKPLQIGTVLSIPAGFAPTGSKPTDWHGSYVVRAGDTLDGIAVRYGVSLSALGSANGIDPAGVLLVGTRLTVPHPAQVSRVTITVRAGDTLGAIAAHYGVSLAALSASNDIDPTALLLVGRHLIIPSGADATPVVSNPYPRGAVGFDVSYPNCRSRGIPEAVFAVIGLNGGRPFTTNPCFESEYAAARASNAQPSIYLNAAYGPALFAQISDDCRVVSADEPLSQSGQRAYAVGCSEARAAGQSLAASPAAVIWIDVEPANTWSKRQALNRAAIQGFVDELLTETPRPVVGVYSNATSWRQIMGAWDSFGQPEWLATSAAPDPPGCPEPFSNGPVWMSQHTTTLDLDIAC